MTKFERSQHNDLAANKTNWIGPNIFNPFQARPFERVRYWMFAERGHLGDNVGVDIFQKELLEA